VRKTLARLADDRELFTSVLRGPLATRRFALG